MQLKTTSPQIIDQERRTRFQHSLLLTVCCILTFASCDNSFQPLKENDRYNFNISGYLDASADTQWVRVGTIRESINEPPDPEGIRVTLQDMQSGETVVMNDSVFTSRNVLNYWTMMNIKNEQTYQITAEHADGKTSRVTVTTPTKVPSAYIIIIGGNSFYGESTKGANIYIDDAVEHIVDVQSVWYVILNPETERQKKVYRFPVRNTLTYTYSFYGAYAAFANWEEEWEQIEQSAGNAELTVVAKQFFVATGGPEWDDSLSSIDDLEYFLDGTASNVENGLGYVVGISSGWFRQATCLNADRSGYAPCPEEEPYW